MMRNSFLAVTIGLSAVSAVPALGQSGKKSAEDGASVISVADCASTPFAGGKMTCACPEGSGAVGSIWGSGPYTGDSAICKAAVHAGVIPDAGGTVTVIEAPGQDSYEASVANGVTSSGWGSYRQSFDFEGAERATVISVTDLPICTTIPAELDQYECTCPADGVNKPIWGNDPFTADSDICTVARFVGYIEAGDGGDVYALRVQGLASYYGDENNGITSAEFGSYSSSIIFDWNR